MPLEAIMKMETGLFNKTIYYEKGIYYKDWHCNMDKNNDASFGLGIWPKGNTKIRVKK